MFAANAEIHDAPRIISTTPLSPIMLALKSEASEDHALLLPYNTVSAAEELEIWARLQFEDMDRESSSNNQSHRRPRAQSTNNSNNESRSQSMDVNNVEVSKQCVNAD